MEDGNLMNNINIVYEDNHLLVVEKPINIPVQEDSSKDKDLLTILKEYIKVKYNKPGNVYLGLVHRLDRPVGGIMVFAKTSKAASRLSDQIRTKTFKKIYNAVVIGKINDSGTLIDRLLKDTNNNIVNLSLVEIELLTGRSHQIRVQMAHFNHPLYVDQKYNVNALIGQQIALFACKIEFEHPTTHKLLTFSLPLPDRVPFNSFDD